MLRKTVLLVLTLLPISSVSFAAEWALRVDRPDPGAWLDCDNHESGCTSDMLDEALDDLDANESAVMMREGGSMSLGR